MIRRKDFVAQRNIVANEDVLCGHFPKSKLKPVNLYCSPKIDEEAMVEEGVRQIIRSSFLPLNFALYAVFVQQFDRIDDHSPYEYDELNYWVNLGLAIGRVMDVNETTQLSSRLYPVVTFLDKILYLCAKFSIPAPSDNNESYDMALVWGYLLRRVQRKELQTGKTIDMDAAFSHSSLLDIILGYWDEVDAECFRKLTYSEYRELQQLFDSRQRILEHYQEERNNAKNIAEETKNLWAFYISLINKLSEQESHIIDQIISEPSDKEKLRAIEVYLGAVQSMLEQQEYCVDELIVSFETLRDTVKRRTEHAVNYVCLSDGIEDPYRLSPVAFRLVVEPYNTFNFLHIVFQRFRLNPTIWNAKVFVETALKDLMNNLNIQEEASSSLDEMIKSFCSIASSFVDEHRAIIKDFGFQSLQGDAVAANPEMRSSSVLYEFNLYDDYFRKMYTDQVESIAATMNNHLSSHNECASSLQELINSYMRLLVDDEAKFYGSLILEVSFHLLQDESSITNLGIDPSLCESIDDVYELLRSEKIEELPDDEQLRLLFSVCIYFISKQASSLFSSEDLNTSSAVGIDEEFRKKAGEARQIVISVDIIYLMHEFLEMITADDGMLSLFDNPEIVKKYVKNLKQIRYSIENAAYSQIEFHELELEEYRKEKGYDTKVIARKERHEEKIRNAQTNETIISGLEEIVEAVKYQDIEHLFEAKKRIRIKIADCLECDAKEQFAERIDSIVAELCKAFVSCCEKNDDKYDKTKSALVRLLGEHSKRLPPAALNTLTTAELLYSKYAIAENAIKEFAEKGFDYSSISALYYQAFEEAYNEMIWKSYADWINQQLDETADDPSIINKLYWEYLPGNKENVDKYYFPKIGSKKEDPRRVVTYCVFGTFYHLLNVVNKQTTAPTFREWFSRLAGYNRVSDMLVDKEFMNILGGFKDAVNKATPNRNNASHGGSIISKEQCCQDKKTVLSEMETVRSNSLGLIQQLLFIIKGQPC